METSPAPASVLPSSSLVPCSRVFEVRCQGRPDRPKSVGLFAVSSLPGNFTFHEELPVFALQQAVNKSLIRACCNCHRVLGDLHSQLSHFFSSTNPEALERLKTCAVNNTKSLPNPAFSAEVVSCAGGCGEMYCCRSCQLTHMRQSHRYLCVGPLEEGHPIVLFKQLAVQQTENLLLAVEAICKLVSLAAEDLLIHEHNGVESSSGVGTEVSRISCPAEVDDAKFLRILAERESEVKAKTEQLFGVLLGYDHDYWEAVEGEEGNNEASKDRLLVLQDICHCLHAAFSSPVNERQAGAKILATLFESPGLLSQVTGLFEKTNTHIVVPSPLNSLFRNAAKEVSSSAVAQSSIELLEFILREKEVALQRIFGDDEEEMEEEDDDEDSLAYKQRQKEKEHLMKTRFAEVPLGSLLPPPSESETSDNSLNMLTGERSSFQPRSFPDVHGTGFFPSIGRMNHSCAPNVRLVYPHGSNTVAFVTMRPVKQGEELCISYVDGIEEMDDEERTAALDTFGFQNLQAARLASRATGSCSDEEEPVDHTLVDKHTQYLPVCVAIKSSRVTQKRNLLASR
ncbi:histone-lysine n [Cystoisospora suis]|uniref:Histone-lysine n n=1 Tax=Cystoisospora suis TaxID=483139 RepID=A0A2C6JX67_9APIC|nr:histone-lysine n [Cystoisospora suis]